jgi:hypothetical protein
MRQRIKTDDPLHKKLYQKWNNMMQRCYNPSCSSFDYYGEKGIVVCEEWEDFEKFFEWAITSGYKDGLVLSRKTNKDDYSPETCEWITDQEHRAKRGINKEVLRTTYNGKVVTLTELSDITGICRETLKYRYKCGIRGEDLVNKPYGVRYTYTNKI